MDDPAAIRLMIIRCHLISKGGILSSFYFMRILTAIFPGILYPGPSRGGGSRIVSG
jgi:hypothetical protein